MGLSRWPLKLSLPRLDRSTLSTACLTTRTTLPDASPGVGQWGTYREHSVPSQGLFSRILAHYWWRALPFSPFVIPASFSRHPASLSVIPAKAGTQGGGFEALRLVGPGFFAAQNSGMTAKSTMISTIKAK